ncbi:MAG: stage 0 sporulation family protein [Defluviitaleaceae bacterium]|nr:stage 0 sporulation family protein [Defluviitaleaceae bacterium]
MSEINKTFENNEPIEIIGVRFKPAGKIYFFDPDGMTVERGKGVIAETIRGMEYGNCEIANKMVEPNPAYMPLRKIIRVATDDDLVTLESNKKREEEAFVICGERIVKHDLGMKLVDVELTFDATKIIFYFTADGRVDFRELVKELAGIFRMRIELRQIGVRDESKLLNGIGVCGRTLCCATFLPEFHPVSIKMAKDQNLSLSPSKISGVCGRLMCCLKYEEEHYNELNKIMPGVGDIIKTPDGQGEVISTSILRQTLRATVRKTPNDTPTINQYHAKDIKILKKAVVPEYDPRYKGRN